MKVGLDIDGTLTKTFELFIKELRELGFLLSDTPEHKGTSYSDYTLGCIPSEYYRRWYAENFLRLRRLYAIQPGVQDALQNSPHTFVAVTNRCTINGSCPSTLSWIQEHSLPISQVFFTQNKVAVCKQQCIDIFVEDTVHNALALAKEGIPVLLINAYYNQNVSHPFIKRFFSWQEIPSLIEHFNRRKSFS